MGPFFPDVTTPDVTTATATAKDAQTPQTPKKPQRKHNRLASLGKDVANLTSDIIGGGTHSGPVKLSDANVPQVDPPAGSLEEHIGQRQGRVTRLFGYNGAGE